MSILDNIQLILCNPSNYGGTRKANQIKYLVYHYTGNDGDHDTNNAKYYQNNVVQASAHFFVDDDSVTQSVPDLRIAWAVGGKKWADCNKTGGGTLYGIATNTNSLSIEMCDTRADGTLMATKETLKRAAELGRALMAKYNIPIEQVIRHFDVTGKHCPAYFMEETKWQAFKRTLAAPQEDDTMTKEQFKEMMDEYLNERGQIEPSDWSTEHRAWAEGIGLIQGDENGNKKYKGFTTREEMITFLHRLYGNIVGK